MGFKGAQSMTKDSREENRSGESEAAAESGRRLGEVPLVGVGMDAGPIEGMSDCGSRLKSSTWRYARLARQRCHSESKREMDTPEVENR